MGGYYNAKIVHKKLKNRKKNTYSNYLAASINSTNNRNSFLFQYNPNG